MQQMADDEQNMIIQLNHQESTKTQQKQSIIKHQTLQNQKPQQSISLNNQMQLNHYESNLQSQPTFQSNISALMELKKQLQSIYYQYSQSSQPNIHHLQQVTKLKQEVADSKQRILKFKSLLDNMETGTHDKIQSVEREKNQLIQINESIVNQSEELANKLKIMEQQNTTVTIKYEELMKERENQRKKQKKQLQNLKLMHAQQLYMLKKKINSNQQNKD